MDTDKLVQLLVLLGFFLQAIALIPYAVAHGRDARLTIRTGCQGAAVISFGVALVLHLVA